MGIRPLGGLEDGPLTNYDFRETHLINYLTKQVKEIGSNGIPNFESRGIETLHLGGCGFVSGRLAKQGKILDKHI